MERGLQTGVCRGRGHKTCPSCALERRREPQSREKMGISVQDCIGGKAVNESGIHPSVKQKARSRDHQAADLTQQVKSWRRQYSQSG